MWVNKNVHIILAKKTTKKTVENGSKLHLVKLKELSRQYMYM